jgi:hypothetical protein
MDEENDEIRIEESVAAAARSLGQALADAGLPALTELVKAGPSGVSLEVMSPAQARELGALVFKAGRAAS